MKPDLYTKIILTVIAVCLVILTATQATQKAQAYGSEVIQVVLAATERPSILAT